MKAALISVTALGVVLQATLIGAGFARTLLVTVSALVVVVAAVASWVLGRNAVQTRGRVRLAWGLVSAATLLWSIANLLSLRSAVTGDVSPQPHPETFAGSTGTMLALLCLLVGPGAAPSWRDRLLMTVDGAMASAGLFVPAWAYLLRPAYLELSWSFTTLLAVVICAEIATVALALVLLSRHGVESDNAYAMLASAFGMFASATVVYCSFVIYRQTEQMAAVSGVTLVGTFLLLLMGSSRFRTDMPPWGGSAGGFRAALPYLPMLGASIGAVVEWFRGGFDGVLFCGMSVLFVLVLLRQFLALQSNTRLLSEVENRRAQLQHQATHDHLTGLTNRTYLYERAAQWGRTNAPVTLLLLDLDGFKQVNDQFGHAAGDEVLVEVAEVLTSVVPSGHTVARLGGDEFAVVLEPSPPLAEAMTIGEQLIEGITARGRVGASLGIAHEATGRATLGMMLSDADAALYRAKAAGKGRACLSALLA